MKKHPRSYSQLQPEERLTIASLLQQGRGIKEIARVLARPASTISREITRNTCDWPPDGSSIAAQAEGVDDVVVEVVSPADLSHTQAHAS